MTRFILFSRTKESLPARLRDVAAEVGLTIVDEEIRHAILVAGTNEAARALQDRLPTGWSVSQETTIEPPGEARQDILIRDDESDDEKGRPGRN